jgi:hypothetical protein
MRLPPRLSPLACGWIAAIASAPAAQSVHVVDAGGGAGVDFTDLQAAIDAAAPGDTLLVKPGSYAGFALAKSLSITAETDLSAGVDGFVVSGLAASDRVVLRGLVVGPGPASLRSSASDNAGWIGLEDCVFAPTPPLAHASLELTANAAVSLVRCTVAGDKAEGLRAVDTGLYLYDCAIDGGLQGADGAAGIALSGGFLFVEGGSIRGADGLDGVGALGSCVTPGGDGGDGIEVIAGSPTVVLQAALVAGGVAGAPGTGCPPTADGVGVDDPLGGSPTLLGGVAHALDVTTPVRMGMLATNVLAGAPGELAVLAIALSPDATYFPAWLGALSVASPILVQPLGIVPLSGSFTLAVPVPVLGGYEFVQTYEQAAFVAPSGKITLSAPSFPLVLAPAF